jgi:predicted transcriptional regulator
LSALSQERVLQLLKKLGGQARTSEVAKAAGVQDSDSANISKRLSQLVKWGLVVKVKHGLYRVNP